MQSVDKIPYVDIQQFLEDNGKSFENKDDAYEKALILIKDRNAHSHPISVIEWMIAYNLFITEVDIPTYSVREINNMNQNEINQLAKLLTMKKNNPENIKNILKYLNKLSDDKEDLLPEIYDIILGNLNDLEIQSINFEELRHSTVFFLLRTHRNKDLIRKMISKNMEKIILYNDFEEDILKLANFLINLVSYDEMGLARQVFDISNKYEFTGVVNHRNYTLEKSLVRFFIYESEIDINVFNIILKLIGDSAFLINFSNIVRESNLSVRPEYIEELINKLVTLEKYDLLTKILGSIATNNYNGSGEVLRLVLPHIRKAIKLKDYDLLMKYLKIVDLSINRKLETHSRRLLDIDDLMKLNNIS